MLKNTFISLLKAAMLVVVVVGGMVVYADWSAPPASAPTCPTGTPGCNVPINVSSTDQTKTGGLTTKALGLFGTGANPPLVFSDSFGSPVSGPNKIKLFGSANTLGFGIDASTLDYHSPNMHRWNIGSVVGAMTLSRAGGQNTVNVNGNIVGSGDVKGGTRLCIGTDCRDRWPDVPGGGGGGAGDNLGNHIATQDLDLSNHSIINTRSLGISSYGTSGGTHFNYQNNGNNYIRGVTHLDGQIFINPTYGGSGLPATGRVLTSADDSGYALWRDLPALQPQIQTFGPFTSSQSVYPYRPPEMNGWDFCAISAVYNDGGSDNAPPIGCELVPLGARNWGVDVAGSGSDHTSCTIMCMKFN